MGPYIPYGLFQTTGGMCAKFGSDRFRNVDLHKVQTNIQTFIFIYKMWTVKTKEIPVIIGQLKLCLNLLGQISPLCCIESSYI